MAEALILNYQGSREEAAPVPLGIPADVGKESEDWVLEEDYILLYRKAYTPEAPIAIQLRSGKSGEGETIAIRYEAYLGSESSARRQVEERGWHIRFRQQVVQAKAQPRRGWRHGLIGELGPWGVATVSTGIGYIAYGLIAGTWPLALLGGTISAAILVRALARSDKDHTRKSSYHARSSTIS